MTKNRNERLPVFCMQLMMFKKVYRHQTKVLEGRLFLAWSLENIANHNDSLVNVLDYDSIIASISI